MSSAGVRLGVRVGAGIGDSEENVVRALLVIRIRVRIRIRFGITWLANNIQIISSKALQAKVWL